VRRFEPDIYCTTAAALWAQELLSFSGARAALRAAQRERGNVRASSPPAPADPPPMACAPSRVRRRYERAFSRFLRVRRSC